jgi:hypothetical protein
MFRRNDFLEIPADLLKEILKSDDISLFEHEIFSFVLDWGKFQLEKAKLVLFLFSMFYFLTLFLCFATKETTDASIVRLLGDIYESIRFPTMEAQEISQFSQRNLIPVFFLDEVHSKFLLFLLL